MRQRFVIRIRLISVGVLLVSLVLVGRLYGLQIVHGEEYSALAERQYVRPAHALFERGDIFLEDKEKRLISGATIKSGFLLAIVPAQIVNAEETYAALSKHVELDKEMFIAKANKKDDPYEEVAHEIIDATAKKITALNIPGVNLYRENWRYYPGNVLAAQSIGFVGFEGDVRSGRYGLERYFDHVLSRETKNLHVNFFAEIFSNLSSALFSDSKETAGDIVISIEPSVQLFLEDTLEKVQNEWSSKTIGGVIIDPKTGRIYGLAVSPSFNLNEFNKVENPALYKNSIVENVYEMGSIIKPITMAIGLDTDVVTPQTTYYDAGYLDIDGYTIRNFDGRGRGEVPMQEVLNQSLNTGVSYVVTKVGTQKFAEYMRAFGLDEETGIDLPNEARGLMDNLNSPRKVEYATASFGQGIALSPIATVRALSVLANGGELVTPHLAMQVRAQNGVAKNIEPNDRKQIISKETSEEITRMLVEVVDDALLGGTVAKEHYAIAAKTGTAQIAQASARGYYDDRFLHSFFGYFPAYEPRFLIFLYQVEPRGARYASQTLTTPFINIVDYLINYYDIPPDR